MSTPVIKSAFLPMQCVNERNRIFLGAVQCGVECSHANLLMYRADKVCLTVRDPGHPGDPAAELSETFTQYTTPIVL